MHITTIPPHGITPHPITDRLPLPDIKSPEFCALMASMAETGECPRPIALCNGLAVDNLDVLAAAKRLGFGMVPVRQIEEHDAPLVAIADLVTRRQWTKSQIAYLSFPFCEPILKAARARRIANLKTGSEGSKSTQVVDFPESRFIDIRGAKTLDEVAKALGISRDLLIHATKIHAILEASADSELRAEVEKWILTGDEEGKAMALSAVLQGIGGWKSTKGKPRKDNPQMEMFEERIIEGMWHDRRFAGWDRATPEVRTRIADLFVRRMFDSAPTEIIDAVLAAARQRRAA